MKAAVLLLGGLATLTAIEASAAASKSAAAPRALAGMPAPDFTLKALDGRTVWLSDFKGKPLLVNFWATWCRPCRAEIPFLVELSKKYGSSGLEIVGISMDEGEKGRAQVAPFVKQRNVPYLILFGDEAVAAAYDGVPILPQTFFIGRDGKILGSVSGASKTAAMELGAQQAVATAVPGRR